MMRKGTLRTTLTGVSLPVRRRAALPLLSAAINTTAVLPATRPSGATFLVISIMEKFLAIRGMESRGKSFAGSFRAETKQQQDQ